MAGYQVLDQSADPTAIGAVQETDFQERWERWATELKQYY
jgi:hypothetical protein